MHRRKTIRTVDTPRGRVEIFSHVRPQQMVSWQLDPGIGKFSSYRSILTSKQSLEEQARDPQANLCLALHGGETIVGYCVCRPPAPEERWARLRPPLMFEVFGENARGWRGMGLMKPMLEEVCLEPENERRILYIVAYSWHWDLDYERKTVSEYRDTIIHLLQPLGFRQYPTNEPNVCLRPENLFMARIGRRVEPAVRRRFTNLLFGMVED